MAQFRENAFRQRRCRLNQLFLETFRADPIRKVAIYAVAYINRFLYVIFPNGFALPSLPLSIGKIPLTFSKLSQLAQGAASRRSTKFSAGGSIGSLLRMAIVQPPAQIFAGHTSFSAALVVSHSSLNTTARRMGNLGSVGE